MNPAITIINLKHAYGQIPVLGNISFSIDRSDFFIIIGPNGSGKTTLMKIIAGIEPLQNGKVEILERPISEYSIKALSKTIAFVPQSFPIDFPYSIREMVLMGRYPHQGVLGMENRNDMDIALEAMAITGIEHLADRKIDQVSGGERQRAVIARAICQEPEIILLDEPTASLDLSHQVRIMDLMEQLKKEKGISVVMVSHDVNLAAMYADQLLILKNGQITGIGKPEAVLKFEVLEKAYGCTIVVDQSPLGNIPRVSPVPRKFIAASRMEHGKKQRRRSPDNDTQSEVEKSIDISVRPD
ncbi:MAG: ABC transporter ATP-binding protein [Thermodesulfobacteriota bacterium]